MDALTADYRDLLRRWMEIGPKLPVAELLERVNELEALLDARSGPPRLGQVLTLPMVGGHLDRGQDDAALDRVAPRVS